MISWIPAQAVNCGTDRFPNGLVWTTGSYIKPRNNNSLPSSRDPFHPRHGIHGCAALLISLDHTGGCRAEDVGPLHLSYSRCLYRTCPSLNIPRPKELPGDIDGFRSGSSGRCWYRLVASARAKNVGFEPDSGWPSHGEERLSNHLGQK